MWEIIVDEVQQQIRDQAIKTEVTQNQKRQKVQPINETSRNNPEQPSAQEDGSRNIDVGGDANQSIFVTGDHAVVSLNLPIPLPKSNAPKSIDPHYEKREPVKPPGNRVSLPVNPNRFSDPRPIFSVHITQQGDNHLRMQFGANSPYKNHPNVPLVNSEHTFYYLNNHSLDPAENLFRQGFRLYESLFSSTGDGWKTALDQKDGRFLFVVDAETSKLPWEALVHPTSGFVERYLLHPIVRKLRETDGEEQVLYLDKPKVGLICVENLPLYYKAINNAVPAQLKKLVNYVNVFDASQPWDGLLAELRTSEPSILHIVADGIGTDGFTTSPETLPEEKMEQFVGLFTQVTSIKLLMLCSNRAGELMQAHYQLFERLSDETGLATVVFIPSNPKNDSAALFTSALYKSLWRGHNLDEAVAAARTQLRLESFEDPNQGRLPMTYQTNLTVNPMENWLQQLEEHLKISPFAQEYVDELSRLAYDIQAILYQIIEIQKKAGFSRNELSSEMGELHQMLQDFSEFLGMMDQKYNEKSQKWRRSLSDKFFSAEAELQIIIKQAKTGKVPQYFMENGISQWEKVLEILNECPNY